MKNFKRFLATLLAVLMALGSCAFAESGAKWTETKMADGWVKVENQDGPTLGYSPESGVTILEVNGYAFKDLNKNGELDVYEDWRLDAQTRAENLAGKMSIEQISGLRYTAKDPGADSAAFKPDLDRFVRHFLGNALQRSDTVLVVKAINEMQPGGNLSDHQDWSRPSPDA